MIKQKYPSYQGVDDIELANKILEKYPTYQDLIVKKKEDGELEAPSLQEFEPASTEAFLAFTPTSEVADTDLGLSSERKQFDYLAQEEKDWLKGFDAYRDADQYKFEKPDFEVVALPEAYEMGAIEDMRQAEEKAKLDEEIGVQMGRNLYMNPINNAIISGVEGMLTNARNSIASKAVLRQDQFGSSLLAGELNKKIEESRLEQEREKTAQKILLGATEEGVQRGISENFKEGDLDSGFASLFVDGVYAAIDAPRTALPFIAGNVAGAAITGASVFAEENSRLLSDPTMSKQERVVHSMANGVIEGTVSALAGYFGVGVQKVFSEIGEEAIKEASKKAIDAGRSKLSSFLMTTLGEAGEEAVISVLTQRSDMLIRSEFGKNPDKFNLFEVVDAATLGFIGAAGPGGYRIASLPSSKAIGHSTLEKEKQDIDTEFAELQAAYDRETDPDIKKARRQELEDKFRAYDALNGMQEEAYSTLNDEESVQIASVNRRILNLESQVKRGKDLAGIEYNADQIASKKSEIDSLREIKRKIEGKAYQREYAEANKGQLPLFVEDAEGNQVETVEKPVSKEVVENHKKLEVEEDVQAEETAAKFILDTEALKEMRPSNFVEFTPESVSAESLAEKEVPTEFHQPLINLTSSFSNALKDNEIKIVFHKNADSYAREVEGVENADQMMEQNKFSLGTFRGNTIHIYDYTQVEYDGDLPPLVDTARHEFSHAVFKSIIGSNAESRTELYSEIDNLRESNKHVNKLMNGVEKAYEGRPQEELEEEAIVALLVDYAANPSKYSKSVVQRIIDFVNRVFSKYTNQRVISNDTDLINLAKRFEEAARTGKEVKVEQTTAERTEGRASKPDKPFTYLQQSEVFYTYNPQARASEITYQKQFKFLSPESRSVRITDYNHYRNWYNKMTGNGRVNTITGMYHIENGKKKPIKPPRPKTNKDGSLAYIELPKSAQRVRAEKLQEQRERSIQRTKDSARLRREAYDLLVSAGYRSGPTSAVRINLNVEDFIPREEGMDVMKFTSYTEKTPEMYESAIRNIQALIESGFDPELIEDKYFSREKNIEAFTMAEGDYRTPQEIADDELTKPEEDGSARDMGVSRASRPIGSGVELPPQARFFAEKNDIEFIDLQTIDEVVTLTMGYDKTMHSDFGEVSIGRYFKTAMNSGVNSRGFLSASSASKAKGLAKKLNKAAEMARESGQDYIQVHYVAQDSKHVLGNTQAFDLTLDYLFDHYETAIGYLHKAEQDRHVKRLRNFLIEKTDGAVYINGSKSEPGVLNVLRDALPRFMQEKDEYADYVSRNGKSLKVKNIEDYKDIKSAISSFVKDRNMGRYFESMRKDYPVSDTNKNKISYLYDLFQFRVSLMDAFLSEKDGLYSTTNNESNPEGLKPFQVRRSFISPVLQSFQVGEVMGVQEIKLQEGAEFSFEEKENTPEGDPFAFSLTYPTFDPSEKSLKIPSKRHHYFDIHSDIFESIYDKEFEKQGIEVTNDVEFFKSAQRVIKESKSKLNPKIRGGLLNRMNMGMEHSYLIGSLRRSILSQDSRIDGDPESRQSIPLFMESNDDSGNTWQIRTKTSMQEWRDKWLIRLQDKYRGIFLLQEDVESFKGRTVKESEDFKMAEETMYGKASYDLKLLDEKLEQITEALKISELTVDDLSEYMYALHAEERNKVIEERSKGEIKDGSGLSTEEANEILNSISEEKKLALDDIVSLVRDMQQDTRNTMVKFGLEKQETIDAFEKMFSNYIPLSGLARDEESSVTSAYPTGGAGLAVFGDQTKRAKGRKSRAENVLAQAVAQNASVHIEARKNEAMNALYNLVKNNPNPNVWSILDNANALDPHVVAVRIDGNQKFIRFKDASYASALKNMNMPQTNQFIRLLRAPSNWLRAAFTTQNPEFLLSNFSRDIQSAVFNAAAESEIEGGFLNGQRAMNDMFGKIGPSLKTLLRDATGRQAKADPVVMRYYEEYQADGGKTGWAYMKSLDEIAESLQGDAKTKNKAQEILGSAKNVLDFVEGVNDAFENSIRLAAYISARENNVSRAKAAQFAKNITVNFNKHGEWGQTLNAVYLFFNASVQGTARLGRSLLGLKPPVKPDGVERRWYERATTAQKMATGLTIFNGMLTMIGMAMSDEDEDDELYWTKIPDYVKERNMIIMRPDGKNYWKIPMPYGYNVFANMGTAAVEGAAGTREFGSAAMFVASSFINSFSPMSFGESKDLSTKALKSVIPTSFKPMVDIATNETYFGSPVYSKRWDDSVPASSMSFRSPEAVKDFFSWMNEATGGSQDVPGFVDMNPDKLWYGVEYFMGGPGLFVERTAKTVRRLKSSVIDKNEVDLQFNDVPMLRIIYGEPSKYYDMEKYSDRKLRINGLKRELERTKEYKNPRYDGIIRIDKMLKATERKLKKLRAEKKEARNIKDFGKRTAEIQRIMDEERSAIMKFNKYYSEQRQD